MLRQWLFGKQQQQIYHNLLLPQQASAVVIDTTGHAWALLAATAKAPALD
jgi:hypothetical protein